MSSILIVGAGFGGLGTAALLAKQGHSVTLLEKNEGPGGRASVWEEGGFRFDMGPSWYLMRDVFNRFFAEFGKKDTDFYDVVRLDPAYRIYFEKGKKVDISSDFEKNVALFESLETGGGERFREYVARAKRIYESSMEAAVYQEPRSILDFVRNEKLRSAGKDLPLLENIDNYVQRYFKDETARKLLEYSILFLGGSPKNTPALYSLMSHVDFNMGVWFPMGGIISVVRAIESVGRSLGVNYIYNSEVTKLDVEKGRVTQIHTNNGVYSADVVIMNGDMPYAETKLLDREYQTFPEKYWAKKKLAPSAFLIYLGIGKKLEKLAHHTIFSAEDWSSHFEQIFADPQWPEHPSYYVNCPTKSDSSLAPEGCENLFVLVPVAAGMEDIAEVRESYAKKILGHFSEMIGEEIEPYIRVRRIFSQRDFSSRYYAYKGSALGLAHTATQSSIFRPGHKSKKVKNLYYVGQYTNPGIGMPMCLISAMQVRDQLEL